MVQLQAINNILATKDIEPYIQANITVDYFGEYSNEYKFMLDHYNKFGKVPDDATFFASFPDVNVVQVLEPVEYIIENLKEYYLYEQGVDLFQHSAKLLEQNSYDGLQYIRDKSDILLQHTIQEPLLNINGENMIQLKEEDIKHKINKGGLIGISSGLTELDKILGGWLPGEELVIVLGRINQGKSWILEKFATEANKQGKRVLYYSGEMSTLQVAYRNDTLGNNFSNRQLMRGTISDADLTIYLNQLQQNCKELPPFFVVTPKELGGAYLTTGRLKTLIKQYKPDMVLIDQLSLMSDDTNAKEKRIQLAHITMGLYNISTEFGIPIIAASQAKRKDTNTDDPQNPELADISESDAIGQNASRVLSLVQTKLGLSLKITKNRYGDNNAKLIYSWDIDEGIFRYIEEERQGTMTDTAIKPRNAQPRIEERVTDIF